MTERPQQPSPGPGGGAAPPLLPGETDTEPGTSVLEFPPAPPADDPREDPDGTLGDALGDVVDLEPAPDGAAVAGVPLGAGRLAYVRRPDVPGGVLLLLAGVAAAAGLWLPWEAGGRATGLDLLLRATTAVGDGVGDGLAELARTGLWQPAVVVAGGAVLGLLGLLLLRPARGHRVSGVVALAVAVAVAAAVVARLGAAGWDAGALGPGVGCGAAVAALGVLGALKAMLTAPRVTTAPAGPLPVG